MVNDGAAAQERAKHLVSRACMMTYKSYMKGFFRLDHRVRPHLLQSMIYKDSMKKGKKKRVKLSKFTPKELTAGKLFRRILKCYPWLVARVKPQFYAALLRRKPDYFDKLGIDREHGHVMTPDEEAHYRGLYEVDESDSDCYGFDTDQEAEGTNQQTEEAEVNRREEAKDNDGKGEAEEVKRTDSGEARQRQAKKRRAYSLSVTAPPSLGRIITPSVPGDEKRHREKAAYPRSSDVGDEDSSRNKKYSDEKQEMEESEPEVEEGGQRRESTNMSHTQKKRKAERREKAKRGTFSGEGSDIESVEDLVDDMGDWIPIRARKSLHSDDEVAGLPVEELEEIRVDSGSAKRLEDIFVENQRLREQLRDLRMREIKANKAAKRVLNEVREGQREVQEQLERVRTENRRLREEVRGIKEREMKVNETIIDALAHVAQLFPGSLRKAQPRQREREGFL